MNYLFDTDAVSIFYDAARMPEHLRLKNHVSALKDEDVLLVSVLTLFEFEYSFWNADTGQQVRIRDTITQINHTFDILPLQQDSARVYGEIKSLFKQLTGRKPKEMKRYNIDLLIASTAITETSVIIGSDRLYRELASIYPRFKTENWFI